MICQTAARCFSMFRRIDYCVQDVPHGGDLHVSYQLDQYLAGRASSARPHAF
jgi:hypothetical protein